MSKIKITTENWINSAKLIHGDKYNYSKVDYKKSSEKVCILCQEHGEFWQRPNAHLSGKGCLKCAIDYRAKLHTKPMNLFILECNIIHNNKYDYSLIKYNTLRDKIILICPIHGEFSQRADNHLIGNGCPLCKSSKGELIISNWFKEHNISFKSQYELITSEIARDSNLIRIDFFVVHNDKQYFIEYDGIQHFEYTPFFHRGGEIDFDKEKRRDKVLNEFCNLNSNKITLIRFKYNQNNEDITAQLKTIFKKD